MSIIEMTEKEFVTLLQDKSQWTFESSTDGEIFEQQESDMALVDGEVTEYTKTRCSAWGVVEAVSKSGINIAYQKLASWMDGDIEALRETIDHGADVFAISRVAVFGDDGEELSKRDLWDLFEDHAPSEFTDVDWSGILPGFTN